MAAHDDKFVAKCLPKHNTMRSATVSYRALSSVPGGTSTTTAGISVLFKHQADLSPATQGPYQQRAYWVPTATIASPQRSDQITDADGQVWTIVDVRTPRSGLTYCQCRIAQVNA